MIRRVTATEAKNRLGAILGWVSEQQGDVIVESRNRPAAAIVPIAEYEKLQALRERERRTQLLEQLRTVRQAQAERNADLTPEAADALANRGAHEMFADMARRGAIRFERDTP